MQLLAWTFCAIKPMAWREVQGQSLNRTYQITFQLLLELLALGIDRHREDPISILRKIENATKVKLNMRLHSMLKIQVQSP